MAAQPLPGLQVSAFPNLVFGIQGAASPSGVLFQVPLLLPLPFTVAPAGLTV